MNLLCLILILSALNIIAIDINYNRYKLRNFGLRFLVFKEKKAPKLFKRFQHFYERCYNKSITSIAKGVNDYNELSEDDRLIIETIISLCY